MDASASYTSYEIGDLRRMCSERREETTTLEFKSCNELKIGSTFYDRRRARQRARLREDVVESLSRQVTAFLNSAGGTIIYGITERDSRASGLDESQAFSSSDSNGNVTTEKIVEWLRFHVRPASLIHPYRVHLDPSDTSLGWFLVIDVPQGNTAYMASDHRYHRRVGSSVRLMEHYEVVDVMNRVRGAALYLRLDANGTTSETSPWCDVALKMNVTSMNFIASEYGAARLTVARPLEFRKHSLAAWHGQFGPSTGLDLGDEDVPHAQSFTARWGANQGNVVFPGAWYDFYSNAIGIRVPSLCEIPRPTYLVRAELFTINAVPRSLLYAITANDSGSGFRALRVPDADRDRALQAFWRTYHSSMHLR